MRVNCYLLRPDLDSPVSFTCDSYKCEIHPVTGKMTVHIHNIQGSGYATRAVVSGVIMLDVARE